MSLPPDFDELLALEDERRAREELLFAEADAAFRADVGLVIEIAKAATSAAEVHARHGEEERTALDPSTTAEEAERLRKAIRAREGRRRAAEAVLRRSERA